MKRLILNSVLSSLIFFGVGVFVIKGFAALSSVSSGTPLTASTWNNMISNFFWQPGTSGISYSGAKVEMIAPLYIGNSYGSLITSNIISGSTSASIRLNYKPDSNMYISASKDIIFRVNGQYTQSNAMFIKDNLNVGIGTASPTSKLDVNGDIKANALISKTTWTVVPSSGNRTSNLYCRRIGSFLQLRGYIDYAPGTFTNIRGQILTLPNECLADIGINGIAASCRAGSIVKSGLVGISATGVLNLYYNDSAVKRCAFSGTYPAN